MPIWLQWNTGSHKFEKSEDLGQTFIDLPLNASILNEGNITDARLPSGVVTWTFTTLSLGGHIAGNLGVGITPTQRLHLGNAGALTALIENTTGGVKTVLQAGASSAFLGTESNHDVLIGANNTEKLRIKFAAKDVLTVKGGLRIAEGASGPRFRDLIIGSVANAGIFNLSIDSISQWSGIGYFSQNDANVALFLMRGGGSCTLIGEDDAGVWSHTAGTAGKANVYWSAANSRFEIQNNLGSTVTFRAFFLYLDGQ